MSVRLPAPTFAEFGERVRCLCALHRASVTSGIRTKRRNAAKGGADASKHLLRFGGIAADLALDENTPKARAELVRDARILGLWAADEEDHVHLQGIAPGGGV